MGLWASALFRSTAGRPHLAGPTVCTSPSAPAAPSTSPELRPIPISRLPVPAQVTLRPADAEPGPGWTGRRACSPRATSEASRSVSPAEFVRNWTAWTSSRSRTPFPTPTFSRATCSPTCPVFFPAPSPRTGVAGGSG